MPNALGFRKMFGVLAPSTNTIVQPDFDRMRPPGVTNHHARIFTPNAAAISNESFMAGTVAVGANVMDAARSVLTANVDYLILGISAITFYGGASGAKAFEEKLAADTGRGVTTGAAATAAALRAFGGIRKIAFFTPYYPVANLAVARFFTESGFTVMRERCLQCPSWTAIAEVGGDQIASVIREIDGDDVDAIVQIGTNLSMLDLAASIEKTLGKPVIAINAALYWHALRSNGIGDQMAGFGRLLAEF